MAKKEYLLYFGLYDYTVAATMQYLNDNIGEEIVMRVNSPGGSVFSAWGLFDKIKEHGDVVVKIDGVAASGALNLLLYAKDVQCLDVSRAMIHRADGYVSGPEQQKMLDDMNKDLRTKLEKRVDAELFKSVTGVSIDELFASDKRIDVWLDAKQMKKLKLVSKINKLEPQELEEVHAAMALQIAASATDKPNPQPTNTGMTLEKLKAEFPIVYAAIVAVGVKEEQDRIGAWLAFSEYDPERVKAGIAGKEYPSRKDMAEMHAAAMSPDRLNQLSEEGKKTPDVQTEVSGKPNASANPANKTGAGKETAEDKELKTFQSNLDNLLKPKAA